MACSSVHGVHVRGVHPLTCTARSSDRIAQAGLLYGGIDAVAPILTNFFLVTYTLTNLYLRHAQRHARDSPPLTSSQLPSLSLTFDRLLAPSAALCRLLSSAFCLAISRVPNYRPAWTLHHPLASLAGAALTTFAMVALNPLFAGVTIAVVLALFAYIQVRASHAWRARTCAWHARAWRAPSHAHHGVLALAACAPPALLPRGEAVGRHLVRARLPARARLPRGHARAQEGPQVLAARPRALLLPSHHHPLPSAFP